MPLFMAALRMDILEHMAFTQNSEYKVISSYVFQMDVYYFWSM